jgi:hypothetical protein
MMANHEIDDPFRGESDLYHSRGLFHETECMIDGYVNCDVGVRLCDEDKMRCHILDCLVALCRVKEEKKSCKIKSRDEEHESAKSRFFNSAVFMIMDKEESTAVGHSSLFFL